MSFATQTGARNTHTRGALPDTDTHTHTETGVPYHAQPNGTPVDRKNSTYEPKGTSLSLSLSHTHTHTHTYRHTHTHTHTQTHSREHVCILAVLWVLLTYTLLSLINGKYGAHSKKIHGYVFLQYPESFLCSCSLSNFLKTTTKRNLA